MRRRDEHRHQAHFAPTIYLYFLPMMFLLLATSLFLILGDLCHIFYLPFTVSIFVSLVSYSSGCTLTPFCGQEETKTQDTFTRQRNPQ